jgi:hypothetical protein
MTTTKLDSVFYVNHSTPQALSRLSRYFALCSRDLVEDVVIRNNYSDRWLDQSAEHIDDKGIIEGAGVFISRRFDCLIQDFKLHQAWTNSPEWMTRHENYFTHEHFSQFNVFWLPDNFSSPKIVEKISRMLSFPTMHHHFPTPTIKKEWEVLGHLKSTSSFKFGAPEYLFKANQPAKVSDKIAYVDLWDECPKAPSEMRKSLLVEPTPANAKIQALTLTSEEFQTDQEMTSVQSLGLEYLKEKNQDLSQDNLSLLDSLKDKFTQEYQELIKNHLWAKLFHYGRKLRRFDNLIIILQLSKQNLLDVYSNDEWHQWNIPAKIFPGTLRLDEYLRSHLLHLYLPPFCYEGSMSPELLEITAAGRVPVCFNTLNLQEYFDASTLNNTSSIEELIERVKNLLANPAELQTQGESLRDLTTQKHLWETQFKEWVTVK